MSRIILYLKCCASVENNITVYVYITMPVVIKLWFLSHFSDNAGESVCMVYLNMCDFGFVWSSM